MNKQNATHIKEMDDDFVEINNTNYRRLHDKIRKVSYPEGVAAGREETFQTGFDQGYTDGLRRGFELQKFRSFYGNIPEHTDETAVLITEKHLFEQMQFEDAKSYLHSKYNPNDATENVSTQQEYVKNLMQKYRNTIPITFNLLGGKN